MWTFFWSFACYSILQNYWFVLNFKEQKWQADPGHTTPAYCGALVDIGANSATTAVPPSVPTYHIDPDLNRSDGFQGPLKSAHLPVIDVNKKSELLIKHHRPLGYLFRLLTPHFPSHPTSVILTLPLRVFRNSAPHLEWAFPWEGPRTGKILLWNGLISPCKFILWPLSQL